MEPLIVLFANVMSPFQVCKNLVLSGVNVTIQDPAVVSESDLSSNYFLTEEDIGENVSIPQYVYIVCAKQFIRVACKCGPVPHTSIELVCRRMCWRLIHWPIVARIYKLFSGRSGG